MFQFFEKKKLREVCTLRARERSSSDWRALVASTERHGARGRGRSLAAALPDLKKLGRASASAEGGRIEQNQIK